MFDNKLIDEWTTRFTQALPQNTQGMRDEMEKQFRQIVQAMLAKLDLVTREEFDIQSLVLAKTRMKLEKLCEQVAVLEAKAGAEAASPPLVE